MADIFMDLIIKASVTDLFKGVATPRGLDAWWPRSSAGETEVGKIFKLDFGPNHQWEAEIIAMELNEFIHFRMRKADSDWNDTIVGFSLKLVDTEVLLKFSHTGWPEDNDHYRQSVYCWAMYLRCLKNYLEKGIFVPYEHRYDSSNFLTHGD